MSTPLDLNLDSIRKHVRFEIKCHGPKDIFGRVLQLCDEVDRLRSVAIDALEYYEGVDDAPYGGDPAIATAAIAKIKGET